MKQSRSADNATDQTCREVAAADGRLDAVLHQRLPEFSRSRIQQWIRGGRVLVDGAAAKPSLILRGTERLQVWPAPSDPLKAEGEDVALRVLYEDEACVVIDKPAGMAVHAGAGIRSGTLVNALVHRFQQLSAVGGELRPGIVHRLDRFTSGAILVARTDAAHVDLAKQFADRQVEKIYLALVEGRMEGRGRIEKPITRDPKNRARMTARLAEGRTALTEWEAAEYLEGFTLVRVRLGTGRTHQIRAHMAAAGHPVAGDRLYGAKSEGHGRYFLHAHRLGFRSPATGERVTVVSPLADELELWRGELKRQPAQKS